MKRYSIIFSVTILIAGGLNMPGAFAQSASEHMAGAEAKVDLMSWGEILKVDKVAGKLTIKHGPLTNLSMPGMTMNFKASNPAMLDQVKAGDKVNFVAEKINGMLTVTILETAK